MRTRHVHRSARTRSPEGCPRGARGRFRVAAADRTGARSRAVSRRVARCGDAYARQLPVSAPALRRADAQAAAPGCAHRVRACDAHQSQQPRARRRPREFGDGEGMRARTSRAWSAGTTHLGHLCGGGTIANFEALWVARELQPGKRWRASAQAHYTHARLSAVLGVPFVSVDVDAHGRMDMDALEAALKTGTIGTVVATLGTTAAGRADPLPDVARAVCALRCPRARRRRLRRVLHARLRPRPGDPRRVRSHARRRLGGDRSAQARAAAIRMRMRALSRSRRGARVPPRFAVHVFQLRRPASGRDLARVLAPRSRGGGAVDDDARAAAGAGWGVRPRARRLPRCGHGTATRRLRHDGRVAPLDAPELDIVVGVVRGASATESSRRAREVFEDAARRDLHLALATFPRAMVESTGAIDAWDRDGVLCLRACAMKPEHREWLPEIVSRLRASL